MKKCIRPETIEASDAKIQINQQHIVIIKSQNKQTTSLISKIKNTMKKLKSILAICILSILITSCAKDGETGPQGSQGPQGAAGTNGSANVSSFTFSISSSAWINGSGDVFYYVKSHAISDVTGSAVIVYIKDPFGNWTAMPVSNWLYVGDQFIYRYNSGGFELDYYYSTRPSSTRYFKAVIIPPSSRAENPNVNYYNYEEVKTTFKLED
jgi:hypothetical protein